MLRLVCIVICIGLLLVTLTASLFSPVVWPGIVTPLVVLLGLVFERWRYVKLKTQAPARFEATGERFVDPETGKLVEVYFDRESGEQRYLESGLPASKL